MSTVTPKWLRPLAILLTFSLVQTFAPPAQAGLRDFCGDILTRVQYRLTAKKRALEAFKATLPPTFNAESYFLKDGMLKRAVYDERLGFENGYFTLKLLQKYRGEERGLSEMFWGKPVKYLTAEEAQTYLVTVNNGGLQWQGQPLKGEFIFVMDAQGNIYVTNKAKAGEFHHSSFVAGQAVAAAGTLFASDGRIVLMTARSGHYEPSTTIFRQAVRRLEEQGADLSKTELYDTPETIITQQSREWIVNFR